MNETELHYYCAPAGDLRRRRRPGRSCATPGQSWIGFRFIDISADDTLRLREWVEADATAH